MSGPLWPELLRSLLYELPSRVSWRGQVSHRWFMLSAECAASKKVNSRKYWVIVWVIAEWLEWSRVKYGLNLSEQGGEFFKDKNCLTYSAFETKFNRLHHCFPFAAHVRRCWRVNASLSIVAEEHWSDVSMSLSALIQEFAKSFICTDEMSTAVPIVPVLGRSPSAEHTRHSAVHELWPELYRQGFRMRVSYKRVWVASHHKVFTCGPCL